MKGVRKLVLDLTEPIKIKSTIEMRQLAVFVGPNGVGKSMILKIVFALGTVGHMSAFQCPDLVMAAQFVFDNTFRDQNFDGSLEAVFSKGCVTIVLEKGQVKSAVSTVEKPPPAIFMSSDMRTFDAMSLYLAVRQPHGFLEQVPLWENMLKKYRLYDVTYMERLIHKCPLPLPKELSETLKTTYDFKEEIVALEVDLEKSEFNVLLKDGSKKNAANYGKGHQAVLNMMIGAQL